MPRQTSVRLSTPQDIPRAVALLNETFRVPVDERTWEWYVHGNPFGATRVYLALDEAQDALAGVFAFTPLPLIIRGARIQATSGHHLVIRPAYRGGAAFMSLSRDALQGEVAAGVRLGIGVPNQKSYQAQRALMKWGDFFWLDCLYKPSPAPRPHDCRELEAFPPDFDRLYARITEKLDFFIEKNAAWMNWRFHGRPGKPYTVYAIGEGPSWAGYVILKRWCEPDGYRKAHIMDLHATGQPALEQLMAAAETYAGDCDELNLWAAAAYPYRRFLEQAGFISRDSARQPVIARTLDGDPVVFPSGGASFSYADADFVY